jgi:hypothetical protein
MKDNRAAPLILLAVGLLLGGCASLERRSCEAREASMRGVKPVTTYRAVMPAPSRPAPRNLPAGSIPMVSVYKLSFKPGFTKPCTTLTLNNEVVIQRGPGEDTVLNEIREFYAEDGTLIASNTQDVSIQVRNSGRYLTTTPLPVPSAAPPGKYKIVNRLMYERRGSGRPAIQIARGEGYFYIIPRE